MLSYKFLRGKTGVTASIFGNFFWVERKIVGKNALSMYLAMYLSFQGNVVIDKYFKMAALEPFLDEKKASHLFIEIV